MQDHPLPKHKTVYILPNLFTTASLLAGFLGIIWAASGRWEDCALAVFVSALLDGLDGKVARLTNSSSEFGVQYDSLADAVAFGVTPSFMIYQMSLSAHNKLGLAACFLFTACSVLRLARFNVTAGSALNKRFFTGLPTPAAGCTLAGLVLIAPHLPDLLQDAFNGIALVLTAGIGLLMVSRVRYASFKELGFFKAHPFSSMVSVVLLFALVLVNFRVFAFLILFAYIISGLGYTYWWMPKRGGTPGRTPQPPQSPQQQP